MLDSYQVEDLPEQFCLTGSDGQFGCFESEKAAQTALDAVTVQQQGEQFCALAGRMAPGNLRCFDTKKEARLRSSRTCRSRNHGLPPDVRQTHQGEHVPCFPLVG